MFAGIGKSHEDEPFRSHLLQVTASLLQLHPVIHSRNEHGGAVNVGAFTKYLEISKSDLWRFVAHIFMSKLRICRENGEGDFVYALFYKCHGLICTFKALSAGIAQAYGHHPLTHHLGQRQEVGVAAKITAATYCYLIGYAAHALLGYIE